MRITVSAPLAVHGLRSLLDDPDPLPRGLGSTLMSDLIGELVRRGHEVVVASCAPDVDEEVVLRGPGLTVHLGPWRPRHRARDAFRAERRFLATAIERSAPQIVHAHWTYEFALGALAAGRPTVVTVHDWAPAILRHSRDAYRAVRLGMQLATLRRGRRFTAVSDYIATRVRPWAAGPGTVVPNGLPASAFAPAPLPSGGASRLLAVNHGFDRRKNTATLLRAHAAIRAVYPEAVLRMAGAGYEPGGAAQVWARQHGLAEGVDFLGPVGAAEVGEEMLAADLFIHPSLEESFGMVLVEAMARGTPVLAGARSGAVPAVLGHGEAGALTDVGDPQALATSVIALLGDRDGRQALGRRGFAHAQQHYGLAGTVDAYERVYDDMRRAGAGSASRAGSRSA